jgi:hypothetical protein
MAETPAAPEYERPRVECVLAPEQLEQEILYAGFEITADNP